MVKNMSISPRTQRRECVCALLQRRQEQAAPAAAGILHHTVVRRHLSRIPTVSRPHTRTNTPIDAMAAAAAAAPGPAAAAAAPFPVQGPLYRGALTLMIPYLPSTCGTPSPVSTMPTPTQPMAPPNRFIKSLASLSHRNTKGVPTACASRLSSMSPTHA